MQSKKRITKVMDGIRYHSFGIDEYGYRYWHSVTHPSYSHYKKVNDGKKYPARSLNRLPDGSN